MIKNYKNKTQIKTNNSQSFGQILSDEDLKLLWISGSQSDYYDDDGYPYYFTNSSGMDNIKFFIYDLSDNLILVENLSPPYNIVSTKNSIILSPGDSLRNNGIHSGQYRIEYDFQGHKVDSLYIESISPNRMEVRLRPIKNSDSLKNQDIYNKFSNFVNRWTTKEEFDRLILNAIEPSKFVSKAESIELKEIFNSEEIYIPLNTYIIDSLNSYEYDNEFIDIDDYKNIILEISKDSMIKTIEDLSYIVDKKEMINILSNVLYEYVYEEIKNKLSLDYFLNFENGDSSLIVNWVRDNIEYPEYPYSVVLKLYEPLPKNISEKSNVWISKQYCRPIIEKVIVNGKENEFEDGMVLDSANFNISSFTSGRDTQFEDWNDLISTNVTTSQALVDTILSSSIEGDVKLNIDYTDYRNFIQFGSAEERLLNFKYKLQLIESYNSSIYDLRNNTVGSTYYVTSSIDSFESKIRDIKNGFDGYEKYLYYQSGSNYSASLFNERILYNSIGEWPKKNTTTPYQLYETTSSAAVSWLSTQQTIAQLYDRDNIHSFVNNIPNYLKVDVNNEDYVNFLYMIGQHFDSIYTYIKHLTLINNRDESIYQGMAKDLTYHVASSLGFDMFNGNDNTELWRWVFGSDITGSYYQGSISGSGETWNSREDVSKEIWRRILNNLPYILKTKGTSRSVKALMACYGIPTSLLTIREYGGPDPRDYDNFDDNSSYIFDDFVYAIDFNGSQYVQTSWSQLTSSQYPQTIEFRFASAPTSYDTNGVGLGDSVPTQSLLKHTNWSINLLNSGSGYGFIEFKYDGYGSIKTDKYRYYDNEFNSVMLNYENVGGGTPHRYTLYTKKSEGDVIIFSSNNTLSSTNSSNFFTNDIMEIGGNVAGQRLTGSMQEFRLYNVPLSESVFNNHVKWPKAYNSNNPERTYYDLVTRYSFDEPKNHNSDSTVSDVKPNEDFNNTGTAVGFSSEINYTPRTEEFSALSPQIGSNRYINNKIRIETNNLNGQLSTEERVTISSYDHAPVDSSKLGIYFSANESINRDIIATFAGIDLLDKVGDPRDQFKDKYTDLTELNNFYWSKYSNRPNYNDYIRLIRQYDQSFFNQLKQLLPARSNKVVGVLVEPNLLERNKVKWNDPISKERLDYSSTISTYLSRSEASHPTYTVETNAIDSQTTITENRNFESTATTFMNTEPYTNSNNNESVIITIANNEKEAENLSYEGVVATTFQTVTYYPYSGSNIEAVSREIQPIQIADMASYTLRRVYASVSQFYTGSDGRIYESGYYDVYDLNPGAWNLKYNELQKSFYDGTLNTIETTIDGGKPVEITYTNPNTLRTTDRGASRLDIE